MKCLVKVNDLYLKDFNVKILTDENIVERIELDSKEFYEFESGRPW